jgi:aminoglycoside phosphotransferase (APT) family kinase protein
MSTHVYRIQTENERFYLRILPEDGASFAPEAEVHRRLRQAGVKVPEVVSFEDENALVGRSIMLTRELPGTAVGESSDLSFGELGAIVAEAGQDVARISRLPVDGFGWIERGQCGSSGLQGETPTFRQFALERWDADLDFLERAAMTPSDVRTLERVVARHEPWLEVESGCLAHGDLDTTHIYQADGRYSGIIDFGEIRGADQWYDLAHFHLRDGERLPFLLGPHLVEGYARFQMLPADYLDRIRFTSLLINVRALTNSLQKRPANRYTRHQVDVLREDLAALA